MLRPAGRLAALVALALAAPAAGAVRFATDLCPAVANPCFVNTPLAVVDGALFDFGERTLELGPNGKLDVGAGTMTIAAGSLRLRSGARLLGAGGSIIVTTTGATLLEATTRVDVAAPTPGRIRLVAAELTVGGVVAAQATTSADGGTVELRGGAITLEAGGRVNASGGADGFGGIVFVIGTGDVLVAGPIDASGGDSGGLVQVEGRSVRTAAKVDLTSGPGGAGAALDVTAAGPVTIEGPIAGQAAGGAILGGGAGADVSIVAGGTVDLAAPITLGGAGPSGLGGRLDVLTDGDLVQRAAVAADAWDLDGAGGDVTLAAGGNVALGDMSIQGTGGGGRLLVRAAGNVAVHGALVADGNAGFGDGGGVQLRGCGLEVDAAAKVSSLGGGGTNVLAASGQMAVRGTLQATEENVLRFRDPALAPVLTGSIAPLTPPVLDATLQPCGVLPPPPPPPPPSPPPAPDEECNTSSLQGVICRVTAISQALAEARPKALGGARRAQRLRARIAHVRTLVEAAARPRRRARSLKAADRQLTGFVRLVGRGVDRGQIERALGEHIVDLGGGASATLKELRRIAG